MPEVEDIIYSDREILAPSHISLQAHLLELQHIPGVHRILRRQHLCNSLAGNSVDLLTITQFPTSSVHMTTSQLGEYPTVTYTGYTRSTCSVHIVYTTCY